MVKKTGCLGVVMLLIALLFTFLNYKYHTQDLYWVNYFGESYNGKIIEVDSTETYNSKYNYSYKVEYLSKEKEIKFLNINYFYAKKISLYKKGNIVEFKKYKDKVEFLEHSPNILGSLFWGIVMVICWLLFLWIVQK
jgi:preprotein translocase subunit SecG